MTRSEATENLRFQYSEAKDKWRQAVEKLVDCEAAYKQAQIELDEARNAALSLQRQLDSRLNVFV